MNRPERQNQPTVEELLVSIRQAIHDDTTKQGSGQANGPANRAKRDHAIPKTPQPINPVTNKPSNGTTVSGSMSQMRVSLQPDDRPKTPSSQQQNENFTKLRKQLHDLGATARHDTAASTSPASGFAGILSGDASLEDALEKLKQAGLTDNQLTGGHLSEPQQSEFRSSEFASQTPEYGTEYDDVEEDYAYDDAGDDFDEPQRFTPTTDAFSPQTRKSYLEPQPPETPYAAAQQPVVPQQVVPQQVAPQQVARQSVEQAPMQAPETVRSDTGQAYERLTSDESAAETSAAFNRLADTIVGHATAGERSIDELTRELLRPMLRSWLDENLPRLVERLVREEIERVARWGGK